MKSKIYLKNNTTGKYLQTDEKNTGTKKKAKVFNSFQDAFLYITEKKFIYLSPEIEK